MRGLKTSFFSQRLVWKATLCACTQHYISSSFRVLRYVCTRRKVAFIVKDATSTQTCRLSVVMSNTLNTFESHQSSILKISDHKRRRKNVTKIWDVYYQRDDWSLSLSLSLSIDRSNSSRRDSRSFPSLSYRRLCEILKRDETRERERLACVTFPPHKKAPFPRGKILE